MPTASRFFDTKLPRDKIWKNQWGNGNPSHPLLIWTGVANTNYLSNFKFLYDSPFYWSVHDGILRVVSYNPFILATSLNNVNVHVWPPAAKSFLFGFHFLRLRCYVWLLGKNLELFFSRGLWYPIVQESAVLELCSENVSALAQCLPQTLAQIFSASPALIHSRSLAKLPFCLPSWVVYSPMHSK